MRILIIRQNQRDNDLMNAQSVLSGEIAIPAKNLVVIFGDDDATASLVDRVGGRTDVFPWREAIWLKCSRADAVEIVGSDRFDAWFPGADSFGAVVLDFEDTPIDQLPVDATLFAIEIALLKAQSGGAS